MDQPVMVFDLRISVVQREDCFTAGVVLAGTPYYMRPRDSKIQALAEVMACVRQTPIHLLLEGNLRGVLLTDPHANPDG